MAGMDRVFRERYPGYRPITDWAAAYDQWTRTTLTLSEFLARRLHADTSPTSSAASRRSPR
jgi:hypothetical protein